MEPVVESQEPAMIKEEASDGGDGEWFLEYRNAQENRDAGLI